MPDPRPARTALSREGIVNAAIGLLDQHGDKGLTFRALAARLGTGVASVYWYVAGKQELLTLATDEVLARSLDEARADPTATDPFNEIRRLAVALYHQLDVHPWAGAYMVIGNGREERLTLWELFAQCLHRAGLTDTQQFYGVSALINYVVGVGRQMTSARFEVPDADREAFLGGIAETWAALDAEAFPRTRAMVPLIVGHDDQAQFTTGLDLLLSGLRQQAAG